MGNMDYVVSIANELYKKLTTLLRIRLWGSPIKKSAHRSS